MTNKTQVKNLNKQVSEIKTVLLGLIEKVETAEWESNDTIWLDEKTNILESALVEVSARLSLLGYEITQWSEETLLKKHD